MRFLALLLLFPALALAYTDTQIHDLVQNRLLERTPSDTPAWWQGLGPNAVNIMIGMYGAENNNFHRIRLLQGLGWIDDSQAVDFIKQQAQDTSLDTLRDAAIRAVARGQGAKEEDWVAKWLKNDDPQTRLAAAESLRDMKDARARDLYSSYLKEEKTPWLVDKLNGKLPVVAPMTPVSSSEDRPSPEFPGTWRGYWMAPDPAGHGMRSSAVILELKALANAGTNSAGFSGRLSVLKHGAVTHAFDLKQASGRSVNLAGGLIESSVPAAGTTTKSRKALQFTFRGALTRVGDTVLLEMKVPEKSSVLVLKKD